MAFGADSGWGEFLVEYLDTTKRELRKDDNYSSIQLPIFGLDSPDAKKKQKDMLLAADRNAPNSGRNAPNSGRNAPNSGRNAPNSGRMLELFLEALNGNMKNPPQSVYLTARGGANDHVTNRRDPTAVRGRRSRTMDWNHHSQWSAPATLRRQGPAAAIRVFGLLLSMIPVFGSAAADQGPVCAPQSATSSCQHLSARPSSERSQTVVRMVTTSSFAGATM